MVNGLYWSWTMKGRMWIVISGWWIVDGEWSILVVEDGRWNVNREQWMVDGRR